MKAVDIVNAETTALDTLEADNGSLVALQAKIQGDHRDVTTAQARIAVDGGPAGRPRPVHRRPGPDLRRHPGEQRPDLRAPHPHRPRHRHPRRRGGNPDGGPPTPLVPAGPDATSAVDPDASPEGPHPDPLA
jgi:hypothetical protein